eukprot:107340-Pyramimonas_sp.AAC.1
MASRNPSFPILSHDDHDPREELEKKEKDIRKSSLLIWVASPQPPPANTREYSIHGRAVALVIHE